jgi:hypothetical protein
MVLSSLSYLYDLPCLLSAVHCNGVSLRLQLSVIDGDAFNDTAPDPLATIMELHTSDEVGHTLHNNLPNTCMMTAPHIRGDGGRCDL